MAVDKPLAAPEQDLTCELFFAFVAPVETDLTLASSLLEELLRSFNYSTSVLQLSERYLTNIQRLPKLDKISSAVDIYLNEAMDRGNFVRAECDDPAALAKFAISDIESERSRLKSEGMNRRAFVFRSFKRPEEINICRDVYGSLFYCIAINADIILRQERLARRINEKRGTPGHVFGRTEASKLVQRDADEIKKYGQKLNEAFANADLFIRNDDPEELRAALTRFLDLIFGKPYVTPTRAELAMMHAQSAAYRSADLSRQVGASIVARDGRLLSTGCNEVPRPGGGQYWAGDLDDNRDFRLRYDINDQKKREIEIELLRQLDSVIIPGLLADGVYHLYEEIRKDRLFENTRVDALIEFGRATHAEMSAITSAALETISIRDSDLYCTTFPCHMCTRLIISAGIRNVFYIEPYPKSAAIELYGQNEISVNPRLSGKEYASQTLEETVINKRVHFLAFEGVAPRRFRELFEYAGLKRKDKITGDVVGFTPSTQMPRRAPFVAAHTKAEELINTSIAAARVGFEQERPTDAPADKVSQGEILQ